MLFSLISEWEKLISKGEDEKNVKGKFTFMILLGPVKLSGVVASSCRQALRWLLSVWKVVSIIMCENTKRCRRPLYSAAPLILWWSVVRWMVFLWWLKNFILRIFFFFFASKYRNQMTIHSILQGWCSFFPPLTLALSSWSNITHLHGSFWSLSHTYIKIVLKWTLCSNPQCCFVFTSLPLTPITINIKYFWGLFLRCPHTFQSIIIV